MGVNLSALPINLIKSIPAKNRPLYTDKLQINSLAKLIMHLPRRYEDRSQAFVLADITPGTKCKINVTVHNKFVRNSGKRMMLILDCEDEAGERINVTFYNQAYYFDQVINTGNTYCFFGTVNFGKRPGEGFSMAHPELVQHQEEPEENTELQLTPIYSTTKGLTQAALRKAINEALQVVSSQYNFEDLTPPQGYPLIPYVNHFGTIEEHIDINKINTFESLINLHNPPVNFNTLDIKERRSPWLLRLICEELLAKQLTLIDSKFQVKKQQSRAMPERSPLIDQILDSLPFGLTNAQLGAFEDILNDLKFDAPMLRLVQGDVGSGKTMVAILAAAQVVGSGYQVAVMAPTEILASQLADSFREVFEPLGIGVGLVTGKLRTSEKNALAMDVLLGAVSIVVGTHAVYSDWLSYKNLGMVIIDEQHRFGVEQRLQVSNKQQKFKIHTLMMSATPAPRSLAMSIYADLDLSVIDELPPGRKPVSTHIITDQLRKNLINRCRAQISQNNRQVYWVCVLIEENENLNANSANETFQLLQEEMPEVRMGLLHGKMKEDEKDAIMQLFKAHELDLLVATTVIEVGVNVPNASIMVIENPERLGLSQIHQLRGRVGRGTVDSFCMLVVSNKASKSSQERLQIFTETNDGFLIAEEDMKKRGTGDIMGTKQSGEMEFMIYNFDTDGHLLEYITPLATDIYLQNPELATKLIERWFGAKTKFAAI